MLALAHPPPRKKKYKRRTKQQLDSISQSRVLAGLFWEPRNTPHWGSVWGWGGERWSFWLNALFSHPSVPRAFGSWHTSDRWRYYYLGLWCKRSQTLKIRRGILERLFRSRQGSGAGLQTSVSDGSQELDYRHPSSLSPLSSTYPHFSHISDIPHAGPHKLAQWLG